MVRYIERYQTGDCEAVWAELVAFGDRVHVEPLYAEAQAVARETMRRVRHNIELLIPRLASIGYVFGYDWAQEMLEAEEQDRRRRAAAERAGRALLADERFDGWFEDEAQDEWGEEELGLREQIAGEPPVRTPPGPDIDERIGELVRRVGAIPLSLEAWYREVGGVNFIGTLPPHWHLRMPAALLRGEEAVHTPDPLYVEPIEAVLRYVAIGDMAARSHRLFIAPDEDFKFLTGGGGPYEMAAPAPVADEALLGEWHHTTFVDYLRICMRWGGLPGLPHCVAGYERDVASLTADLLPI
jgi:hypothetical protein